jgi:hypothetical protein
MRQDAHEYAPEQLAQSPNTTPRLRGVRRTWKKGDLFSLDWTFCDLIIHEKPMVNDRHDGSMRKELYGKKARLRIGSFGSIVRDTIAITAHPDSR